MACLILLEYWNLVYILKSSIFNTQLINCFQKIKKSNYKASSINNFNKLFLKLTKMILEIASDRLCTKVQIITVNLTLNKLVKE